MCPFNQPNASPSRHQLSAGSYCIALAKCVIRLFKAAVIKQFRVLKTVGLNRPSHRFESPKLAQNGVLPFSTIDSAETPISYLIRTTEHPNDHLIIAKRLIVVWTSARLLLGGLPSEPVAKTFQNGFDRAAAIVGQKPVSECRKPNFSCSVPISQLLFGLQPSQRYCASCSALSIRPLPDWDMDIEFDSGAEGESAHQSRCSTNFKSGNEWAMAEIALVGD